MSKTKYIHDLWRMLWPLAVAGLVAWALHRLWPMALVIALQLIWQIWQKWRLARWLARAELLEPPHAGGLWEDYYTRLMHLFRHEQQTQAELESVIFRARNVLNSLDEGVIFLTEDYRLRYLNHAACHLLGLVAEDTGDDITNLVRRPEFRQYLEARDFDQALEMPSPQRAIMLSIKVTALGHEGFLLRLEDITHVHQLESMKRDFVANVSHELKTPITVFKGAVELLQDHASEQSLQYQKLVQTMHRQSERMEKLVASLLLLASLEGEKEPEKLTVDVNDLLAGLRRIYDEKARHKQQTIAWQIAPELRLHGVGSELESAFANLLGNAIDYSPEQARIVVSADKRAHELVFSVQDDGPGIASHHLPHLTERFYRVDPSRSHASGGTGLGLAIVKHVLQRHQGHLRVRSRIGQGSTFMCTFAVDE